MTKSPSLARKVQCWGFRCTSAVLSLGFLLAVVIGAAVTSIPLGSRHIWTRIKRQDPRDKRPFAREEERRRVARKSAKEAWKRGTADKAFSSRRDEAIESELGGPEAFPPTEGGPDPIICDVGYYARRVGLDSETLHVETEDGFVLELWHIYNPNERRPTRDGQHAADSAEALPAGQDSGKLRKYPVLLIHGLLQSGGAFCCTDDDSLAFFLAKSGYDVWIGNNRCGFQPEHRSYKYRDRQMWAWDIREMGTLDLPALISRVLLETGFEQLGLVAHSQGTAETLVGLTTDYRPEMGSQISVFCALAPAAYAGPLIGKKYFRFMNLLTKGMFRLVFGVHAFIPFMMHMHAVLPGRFYGAMGYRVFSFLFDWTDDRWELDLRHRMFQFAPVYVSAESMRWWLGRECFATQQCILTTKAEKLLEDREDEEEDEEEVGVTKDLVNQSDRPLETDIDTDESNQTPEASAADVSGSDSDERKRKRTWYDKRAPPMAFWVCGADQLVDGRRLLRRFERGREPHVDVVHSKIIEGYEHLDVIWAMDSIDKVGKEVRDIIWRTASEQSRRACRLPAGCENSEPWTREHGRVKLNEQGDHKASQRLDATVGEWKEEQLDKRAPA